MCTTELRNRDALIRQAAFDHLRTLSERFGLLTNEQLKLGFQFAGERWPLMNPQRGIFKPRHLPYLLSIKTVVPRTGGRIWYEDQRQVHGQIYAGDEVLDYAFMGTNPSAADNRWLYEAWQQQIPIIYFLGVSPGKYLVIMPTFIVDWNAARCTARIAFGDPTVASATADVPVTGERRYALREVKQRLHQASFRELVLGTYENRCAISGLPAVHLLDAAHIIADRDELLGQPVVSNGIALSKLHHAAFDQHLLGIDPDYRLHVSENLLMLHDGPLLENLKTLNGQRLHLPRRQVDYPDPERLERRFADFLEGRV